MQLSLDTALLSNFPAPAPRTGGGGTFVLPALDGAAVIDGPNFAGAGKDVPPVSLPAVPDVPILTLVGPDAATATAVTPPPANPVALLAARLNAFVAAAKSPVGSASPESDAAPIEDDAVVGEAVIVPFAPFTLAVPLPIAVEPATSGATVSSAIVPAGASTSIAPAPQLSGTRLDDILAKIAAVVAPRTPAIDASAPPVAIPVLSPTPSAPTALPTTAEMFGLVAARDGQPAPTDAATLTPALTTTHAIAAAGAAHASGQAPLDLRQDSWPQAMIDRIEALRDAAEETSTRIRVVPDALGPIDLSLRREGEAVHVRLAAEHAATRALLTETQRTLTDLADQRGVKLASTTVEHGPAGEQSGRGWQHGAPSPFARPASPPSATTAAVTEVADDDTRIA